MVAFQALASLFLTPHLHHSCFRDQQFWFLLENVPFRLLLPMIQVWITPSHSFKVGHRTQAQTTQVTVIGSEMSHDQANKSQPKGVPGTAENEACSSH